MSISEVEVVPLATQVDTSDDELTVSLADGRRVSVPLVWFPRLLNASPEERSEFRLIGGGEGIHWPQIDEDVSVAGLLRGARAQISTTSYEHQPLAEYRRRKHDEIWHWSSHCGSYPAENYFVRSRKPASNLCSECAAKS